MLISSNVYTLHKQKNKSNYFIYYKNRYPYTCVCILLNITHSHHVFVQYRKTASNELTQLHKNITHNYADFRYFVSTSGNLTRIDSTSI